MSIGIDIVEVERIRNMHERLGKRFLERIFTPLEIEYCFSRRNSYQSLAGRFAVKEAVLKALGIGMSHGFRWKDIEVVNEKSGKPNVKLYGKLKQLLGSRHIEISISHTENYAVAVCIILP